MPRNRPVTALPSVQLYGTLIGVFFCLATVSFSCLHCSVVHSDSVGSITIFLDLNLELFLSDLDLRKKEKIRYNQNLTSFLL